MTPYFFLLYYFFFFLNLLIIPPSHGTPRQSFTACSESVSCGSIHNISYPFWGLGRPSLCGRPELQLFCERNSTILLGPTPYKVLWIESSNRTITLAYDEFLLANTTCPQVLLNTTLDSNLFSYKPVQNDVVNLTLLYQCPSGVPNNSKILSNFTCNNSSTALAYYDDARGSTYNESDLGCRKRFEVSVFSKALKRLKNREETLLGVLNEGFRVGYEMNAAACAACVGSGGTCGSAEVSPANFTCYCRYGASTSYPYHCPVGKSDKTKIHIVGVGLGILGSAIIISALCLFYIHRYKKHRSPTNTIQQSRHIHSNPYTLSNLENGDNYLGVNLFSYDELEEATKNFNPSKELGDGGFGTVYHAKLGDGREVAIKRLYENNSKRVQQFMNEIEILARLRHKNLVTLYGCSSQQSRELLLVYEYIPNGTVADHLHGTKRSLTNYELSPLPWHTRLSIAIETASALVYLHASDIIHRDVKTNNILLDGNFCVKVADFGLSRLFPLDVTHVSTSPQGTPGYVDPEYHQCYHLTDKSDVYSFGVVLVELVSSKPAVDMTRHRHEINLSNMAIHKIQNDLLHELVDSSLGFDSDFKVKKEVARVAELAFQCLQQDREMRPTMEEVLETLTSIPQEIKIKLRIDDDESYVGVVQGDVVDIPVDEAFRLKSELSPVSSPEGRGNSESSSARTSQSSC